jgi:hypothetical protein
MSQMTLRLPNVSEQGLTLGSVDGRDNHVRISGSGDTLGVPVLERFLRQLHQQVVERGVTQVTVELGDLAFINSSCLKALVSWIYLVDTNGRPYTIRLLRDATMRWQKNSLATLQRLAPEVVRVEDSSD